VDSLSADFRSAFAAEHLLLWRWQQRAIVIAQEKKWMMKNNEGIMKE
jgi:hypothetical protein